MKPNLHFKKIRDDIHKVRTNIAERNSTADVDLVVSLYEQNVESMKRSQDIAYRRNEIARLLASERTQELIEEGKKLKTLQNKIEEERAEIEAKLLEEGLKIPNMTHPESPKRGEEPRNIYVHGTKPNFVKEPKTHIEMAQTHDLIHFPQISGSSKFYYGKNQVALLETALIHWAMLHISQKYGFAPYTTPDLISTHFAEACGFQPRSNATQMYSIENEDMCLVGTQEIPLASLYFNTILPENDLPIKMIAYGHCFRHETGSNSEDRGIYRVHQFTKVEMFVLCTPEESEKMHKELLDIEIDLLSQLGLHFKVLDMPADDLGASAYRKFDIEAFMPHRKGFGEVTSCSNCTDYQSRRLNIRYRPSTGGPTAPLQYVHTLNATAIAVPRVVLAILENFQDEHHRVKIPKPLIPFMGGIEYIEANPKNL